ncbi:MAG TPA: GNAT family N-acetyltransferase [Geodermatophilus sp.]|nr:GNAT family N-acetyltransferase [Geodermatophilus sp.]
MRPAAAPRHLPPARSGVRSIADKSLAINAKSQVNGLSTDEPVPLTRVTHVRSRPPCARAPRDRATAHAAGLRSAHRGTGRGVRRPGRGPPHRRSDPRRRRHGSPGRPLRSGLARTRLRPERPPRPGDGAFLGRAGLHPWPQWHEIELGFVLARHAQGRALATEAARAWPDVVSGELGLRRLTAVIHPDNAASRALVTRLGFRVHREDVTPSRVRVLVLVLVLALVHELVPAG